MLPAEFPLYFCGLPFRGHQVGRKLRWLLGGGDIRPVMRGVYVDVRVPDSLTLRAEAAKLVIPNDAAACGRLAAWIHGLDTTAIGPEDGIEAQWTHDATGVVEVRGVRVTSPVATAVELAMQLPRPFALRRRRLPPLRPSRPLGPPGCISSVRRPPWLPAGPRHPPARRPPRGLAW